MLNHICTSLFVKWTHWHWICSAISNRPLNVSTKALTLTEIAVQCPNDENLKSIHLNKNIRTLTISTECHSTASWSRNQMKTLSALLALCEGNPPVIGGFPSQRPVTRNFDVFFICTWTNGRANNWDAGDWRRYHAHYDTVMVVSDNGLPPNGGRAIIWTSAGLVYWRIYKVLRSQWVDYTLYYNDIIMSTMAFKSPAFLLFAQPFFQAQIKENIKSPRHWPLWREPDFPHKGPLPPKMFPFDDVIM